MTNERSDAELLAEWKAIRDLLGRAGYTTRDHRHPREVTVIWGEVMDAVRFSEVMTILRHARIEEAK